MSWKNHRYNKLKVTSEKAPSGNVWKASQFLWLWWGTALYFRDSLLAFGQNIVTQTAFRLQHDSDTHDSFGICSLYILSLRVDQFKY